MGAIKLYELTDSYNIFLNMLEEMDNDSLQIALTELKGAIEEKAVNIAKMIRSIDSDIEVIKAEEKRLADRRRSLENKRDSIKAYVQGQMEKAKLPSIKTPTLTVALQNNPPSVEIADETKIPAKFITIVPEQHVPDKKAIKEAIKNGEEVPGAILRQVQSLRIR